MELLWLSIVIYSIGLGVVLYVRPAIMFNENGTWKEFGYKRDSRHTIFPFWLFVITWALVSYVLSMAVSMYFSSDALIPSASLAAATSVSHKYASSMFEDTVEMPDGSESESESESEEEEVKVKTAPKKRQIKTVEPSIGTPVSRVSSKDKPRPGYYVLEPSDKPQGLRKYVYYGPTPP